jgi:hypothetical protein
MTPGTRGYSQQMASPAETPVQAVFPHVRWVAIAWLTIWGISYVVVWGWANFLHLCNIAVILTCVGLWRGSSLLISSQTLSSLVPTMLWDLDVAWRFFAGRHLFGGTEYLWDPSFPLVVRLFSLYHVVWPAVLLWALRRLRYNSRALPFQIVLTIVVLLLSRCVHAEANLNFVFRDPFLHRALGPAWLHLSITTLAVIVIVYWPTHRLLERWFPTISLKRQSK